MVRLPPEVHRSVYEQGELWELAGLCQQPLFPQASSKYAETGGWLLEPEDVKSLQSMAASELSHQKKNKRCVLKEHLEVKTGPGPQNPLAFILSLLQPSARLTPEPVHES